MEQQDDSESIALYALNTLTAADRITIEAPFTLTPELEQDLAEFQATVAALAYSAPPLPMAADLKDRLMQRIAAIVAPENSSQIDSFNLEALKQQAETVQWHPYAFAPQTMVATLLLDEQTREVQCFVRALGAVQFPKHRHAQPEEVIVLEGDLEVEGRVYRAGDRIESESGTEHQPATQTGCLLFLRASIDDQILA